MRWVSWRAAIIGALCAAVLLLGGCSALRLAYGQGPEIAYWWLDGYADFDEDQRPRVREALHRWFDWNRTTQLGDYAALLARAGTELADDATPGQLCAWDARVRSRIASALQPAVPAIAELAPTLSATQIEHIEQRFAKRNADYRDEFHLGDEQSERQRASVKRAVERAESIYGTLDEAQRERIARGVAGSPFDAEVWLGERMKRQADIVATLRRLRSERPPAAEAEAAVRGVLQRIAHSPREAYRAYERTLTQYNCLFAAELHNTTTRAQRQNAQRKLKGWEADLRALAADASR